MIPFRQILSSSILSRSTTPSKWEWSEIQSQVDGLTSSFVDQATDWKSLASMMAGGLAYRFGKIGVMSASWVQQAAPLQRPLSIAFGFASEVTAFEFTNRTLHTLLGEHRGSPLQDF